MTEVISTSQNPKHEIPEYSIQNSNFKKPKKTKAKFAQNSALNLNFGSVEKATNERLVSTHKGQYGNLDKNVERSDGKRKKPLTEIVKGKKNQFFRYDVVVGPTKVTPISKGDSPLEKRQKVGPIIQEKTAIPKPKNLSRSTKIPVPVKQSTKDKSLNTGTSTKERETVTQPEEKRPRTCFWN